MDNSQTNITQVPTAITERSHQVIDFDHVTTTNFMKYDVIGFMEVVPKQSIKGRVRSFARLEPLPVPTFGRARMKNKAFFVPYRTVWTAWTDFINNTQHTYSLSTHTVPENSPKVTNYTFINFFKQTTLSVKTTQTSSDIIIINSDGTLEHRNLTSLGRFAYKAIKSLGYRIVWSLQNPDFEHCALNLLCYAKVYTDWYYPSQYIQQQEYHTISAIFDVDQQNVSITETYLNALFNLVQYISYDNNYFVNAWDKPNSPNPDSGTDFRLIDPNSGNQQVGKRVVAYSQSTSNTGYGTSNAPTLTSVTSNNLTELSSISQQSLDMLKAATDYAKRHQLVGTRSLDRYKSRYGIQLSPEILKRSIFIGEGYLDTKIGDIFSTADTEGSLLGGFAGRGNIDGVTQFDYQNAEEFGMIIVISTIVPKMSLYQGAHRSTLRRSVFDYWTPEYDKSGVQALSTMEVYTPDDPQKMFAPRETPIGTKYNELVFGFVPRYSCYKHYQDMLTGDFTLNTRNTGQESWHLFRNLDAYVESVGGSNNLVHSSNFVRSLDWEQYQRIFANEDPSIDQFKVTHLFELELNSPWDDMYDTYEFDNEDKAQKVNVPIGGTKAN